MKIGANLSIEQDHDLLFKNWYEMPSDDPDALEVWCYTDQISYAPGDAVRFHVSTTEATFSIRVVRDGAEETLAYEADGLAGTRSPTSQRAFAVGCDWPVLHTWTLPADLPSGGYLVTMSVTRGEATREHHHFFVVRATGTRRSPYLLLCTTSTWIAYNNWGGANAYEGNNEGEAADPNHWPEDEDRPPDDVNHFSPILSTQRPWARGQVWLPVGAPRTTLEQPPEIGAAIRYPFFEWAFFNGYSKYYEAAGWAGYERHFVRWAEREGYELDFATQHDIHRDPGILDDYPCVVIVGHDEYWTAPMRDAIDTYVDGGGRVARFGANFLWQVRLEDEGRRQICYKHEALERDPLTATEPRRMSGAWEAPQIGRPGASTFGLNALHAVYAGFLGFSPRNTMGYTVYRPEHWAFAGTDLYFGDTFGAAARIFAYEVDGVDFTFEHGQPIPTHTDGAPEGLEILAMSPSANRQEDHRNPGSQTMGDAALIAALLRYENMDPETVSKVNYGAGMIAAFDRGQGSVFNAASCEWVNGLRLREPMTETITRNVLDRFGKR